MVASTSALAANAVDIEAQATAATTIDDHVILHPPFGDAVAYQRLGGVGKERLKVDCGQKPVEGLIGLEGSLIPFLDAAPCLPRTRRR